MTATDLPVQGRLQTSQDRQARITGGILIGLAIVIALSFAPGPDIVSKFRLSRPGDRFILGDLVVPATAFIYAAAAAVAFLGARQFLRV
ncbi:MAG: hypothetical protein R3317_11860 [Burkholderiaceae bacterium]|nr:hypothetical protein [Burkholderiaceae bacterium]